MPPMPTPRAGAAVAVLGKQILVVGGVGEDQSPVKVVELYNTEEGRWRKRSSLREALMGVSITVKGMDTSCGDTEPRAFKAFPLYEVGIVRMSGGSELRHNVEYFAQLLHTCCTG